MAPSFSRGRARPVRRGPSFLLALAVTAAAIAAQVPQAPPGFRVESTFRDTLQPWLVRALLDVGDGVHLVAYEREVFRLRGNRPPRSRSLFRFAPGDDVAFLAPQANGCIAIGSVSGQVAIVDPNVGAVGGFAGVANGFDAVALGADLLVDANPGWPTGGGHAGVWLIGPGRTPREVLPLVGPSAGLTLCANGDLVVGELGPVVPPPPGTARLLRIPAARVAAAVAGATLSMADVASVGAGYDGIYDVVADDRDRLHVSDPGSGVVVHTAPGGMTPAGTSFDAGPGMVALGMQYLPHAGAPLRGFQPSGAAPRLAIGASDFASMFAWHQLVSTRPRAGVPTGSTVPPGPFQIDLADAPPLGVALLFAAPSPPMPEVVVGALGDVPIWFGLPPGSAFVVGASPISAAGTAVLPATNPGGAAAPVDVQILAVDPFTTGDAGTTLVLHLDLLP